MSNTVKANLQIGLSIVATLCAVTLTGLLLWQKFGPEPPEPGTEPRRVAGWDSLSTVGHQLGSSAGVRVVIFGDFECPACKQFEDRVLRPALERRSGDMQVVFRHWPLSYHRFAMPAAVAAECAATVGRFPEMYHALYRYQDSLGLKPFAEVAAQAGVVDIDAFEACRTQQDVLPVIERDRVMAEELGLEGTPAILIDGVYLGTVPDSTRFADLIAARLRGEAILD